MPEYIVYANLSILGKAYIEAESLEEAKEHAMFLNPYDFEYEYDGVDGAEPIAVYETDEDGFTNFDHPHLEKVEEAEEGTWRMKERGV